MPILRAAAVAVGDMLLIGERNALSGDVTITLASRNGDSRRVPVCIRRGWERADAERLVESARSRDVGFDTRGASLDTALTNLITIMNTTYYSGTDAAARLLKALLAAGPVPSRQVWALSHRAGLRDIQTRRARQRLGIRRARTTRGAGNASAWSL